MINKSPLSSFYPLKNKCFYRIVLEQDAIFSGIEYFNSMVKSSLKDSDFIWHIQDGSCILKNQIGLEIFQEVKELKEIIHTLSYLSGISTLACCYTEAAPNLSIVGAVSPNSLLAKWEVQSLSFGGVNLKPLKPSSICYSREDLSLALKDPIVALSSKLNREEMRMILNQIPPNKQVGIQGDILPRNLEAYSDLPIQYIWPTFLENSFPSIKMKIVESE